MKDDPVATCRACDVPVEMKSLLSHEASCKARRMHLVGGFKITGDDRVPGNEAWMVLDAGTSKERIVGKIVNLGVDEREKR